MNARLRILAFFLMMLCFASYLALLMFTSFHYHTFWALGFGFLTIFVAVIIPQICKGYDFRSVEDTLPIQTHLQPDEAQAMRECGWFINALLLGVLLYAIPVIVWYNNQLSFPYIGVILQFIGNTCFLSSYILFIRIFGKWK